MFSIEQAAQTSSLFLASTSPWLTGEIRSLCHWAGISRISWKSGEYFTSFAL